MSAKMRLRASKQLRLTIEALESRQMLTAAEHAFIDLDDARTAYPTLTGGGYAIAFVDTGFDRNSPAFGPDLNADGIGDRVVYSYDFGDWDGDVSAPASDLHHGTKVASVAAGSAFGSFEGGVAPNADLILLKAVSSTTGQQNLEAALNWVAENADAYKIVTVVVMRDASAATRVQSPVEVDFTTPAITYTDELRRIQSKDVTIVTEAGNYFVRSGAEAEDLASLAASQYTLSVGAVFHSPYVATAFESPEYVDGTLWGRATSWVAGDIAPFSQRHDGDAVSSATHRAYRTFMAPGAQVKAVTDGGAVGNYNGTELAAAMTAGAVVLANQRAETVLGRRLSFLETQELLNSSGVTVTDNSNGDTDNTGTLLTNTMASFRRLNVNQLVGRINGLTAPTTIEAQTVFIRGSDSSDTITVELSGTTHYKVTITGLADQYFVKTAVNRFVIDGRGGNDIIDIKDNVLAPSVLYGGAGVDTLNGSDADGYFEGDILRGGDDADILDGDDGNDVLEGGRGNDTLAAGLAGPAPGGGSYELQYVHRDMFQFRWHKGYLASDSLGSDSVTSVQHAWQNLDFSGYGYPISFNMGLSGVQTVDGTRLSLSLQHTVNGTDYDMIGTRFGDTLVNGQPGGAFILAGSGNDTLRAVEVGAGLPSSGGWLYGGQGSDTYMFHRAIGQNLGSVKAIEPSQSSAADVDTLDFQGYNAALTLDLTNSAPVQLPPHLILEVPNPSIERVLGVTSYANTIYGNARSNLLYGGNLGDMIVGGSNADVVFGGAGDDIIAGGGSADVLYGDDGADTIVGGDGGDFIYGGLGGDILRGNAGVDWLYSHTSGNVNDGVADLLYGLIGTDVFSVGPGDSSINEA